MNVKDIVLRVSMISQKCKMQYGKLNKRTAHHVVMRSIDRKEMTEGNLATRHRGQVDGEVFAGTKFSCCPVTSLERLYHVNDSCMKCKRVYKIQDTHAGKLKTVRLV